MRFSTELSHCRLTASASPVTLDRQVWNFENYDMKLCITSSYLIFDLQRIATSSFDKFQSAVKSRIEICVRSLQPSESRHFDSHPPKLPLSKSESDSLIVYPFIWRRTHILKAATSWLAHLDCISSQHQPQQPHLQIQTSRLQDLSHLQGILSCIKRNLRTSTHILRHH
jgi:hypothetical protein